MPVYLAFTSTLKASDQRHEPLVTTPDEPPFNENFGAPYAAEDGRIAVSARIAVSGSAMGIRRRGRSHHRENRLPARQRHGERLSPIPLPFKMGVPGIGGPMLTKGGVAFLSGTLDNFARAYDVTSGKQLWESRLPLAVKQPR